MPNPLMRPTGLAVVLLLSPLLLSPSAAVLRAEEPWPDLGRLYRDEDGSVLQELWLLGRYQGQYHWSDGGDGEDQGWEDRRFRIGTQARLFERLTLHAQMVSGSDFEPFYNGFTELWLGWRFSDAVTLTVGQQKQRFTHDRNISSRYINYIERGMLTNMFGADYTPAVTLQGRVGPWIYYTGVFSGSTGRNIGRAFTALDSGWSYIGMATRELGPALGADAAHVSFSYLHSRTNDNATTLTRFGEGVAGTLILTKGAKSMVAELVAGLDGPDGDALGVNIQPGWFATQRLQLVGRYQLAVGSRDETLTGQSRYERPAGLGRGDLYQAGYLGLNFHVAEHRLKLMGGLEYARMNDSGVWTASLAVRMFWGPHSRGPFPMAQVLDPD